MEVRRKMLELQIAKYEELKAKVEAEGFWILDVKLWVWSGYPVRADI